MHEITYVSTPVLLLQSTIRDLPGSSTGKESTCNAGDPGSVPGLGRSPGEGISYPLQFSWASLMAQTVTNPPAMRETWVQSLVGKMPCGRNGPLQYSGLENSMDRGAWQSMGSQTVGHD